MQITRHFMECDGRQVHYRRCGAGPALVLLHASPVSSKVHEPHMRIFGQHFTCFAFDTPGNGLSDPLTLDDPDLSDYAKAQATLLSQMGIEKAVLYGRHTGASIAVELARLAPERVTMVMTDGYPVFTPEQRKAYLSGYLSDLPTSEDGGHIPWLWNRYRDQFVFWPWNKRSSDVRADCDMPDEDFIQNGVVALLEAGNNYKAPYRAVFKFDALAALPGLSLPVCMAARPGDSLYCKFSAIPDDQWKVEMPRAFGAACAKELAIMVEHMPPMDAPEVLDTGRRGFVNVGGHNVHFRRFGANIGRPIVVMGPLPGTSAAYTDVFDTDRPVILLDPLCAGESSDGAVQPDQQAALLNAAVTALGLTDFDLAGIGAGGNIALEMGRSQADAAITLIDPHDVDARMRAALAQGYDVDYSLTIDGTHMLRLWMMLRDQMCWFPYFDRRRCAMRQDPCDWARLETDFLSHLKHAPALQSAWRAAWRYDLQAAMADLGGRVRTVYTGLGLIPASVHGAPITALKGAV